MFESIIQQPRTKPDYNYDRGSNEECLEKDEESEE